MLDYDMLPAPCDDTDVGYGTGVSAAGQEQFPPAFGFQEFAAATLAFVEFNKKIADSQANAAASEDLFGDVPDPDGQEPDPDEFFDDDDGGVPAL